MERLPHAVVFPFPTQGHINPLMLCAQHLLRAGITITFVHSARSFSMLQKSQQGKEAPEEEEEGSAAKLHIEVLPDAVSTDSQTPVSPSVALFMSSIPVLKLHLQKLIQKLLDEGRPPSCIIADSFLPWTQDVAAHFGIPRIEFWSSTAAVYLVGSYIPQLISHGYLPVKPETSMDSVINIIPGLGPCRLADLFYDFTHHPITSPVFQFLQAAFARGKEAQRVLVHSMYHLEKDVIHALRKQGVPIDPVGPLLEPVDGSINKMAGKERISTSLLTEDKGCLEWLDTHPHASVIYASFGSNVKISVEEIQELALGLEDSQQPFVLVIRPDLVPDGVFTDALPTGFEERIKGRGRICSWAPQFALLAHPAIGGFLSHCGWNSVLESMWMGVPIIGAPRESEQNSNMKCLLDWKAAIALDVSQCKVELRRASVEKAVRALFHEPEGQLVRRRMIELQKAARYTIEAGQSRANLQKLTEDIKEMACGRRPIFLPTANEA